MDEVLINSAEAGRAERLLARLVESTSIPPIVRAAIEQRCTRALESKLESFASQRAGIIRTVCNEHYAEFIQSVQEVLAMRADVTALRQNILRLNSAVQRKGRQELAALHEAKRLRETRRAISQAAQAVRDRLQLLRMAEAVQARLDAGELHATLCASAKLCRAAVAVHARRMRMATSGAPEPVETGPGVQHVAMGQAGKGSNGGGSGGKWVDADGAAADSIVFHVRRWARKVEETVRLRAVAGFRKWLVDARDGAADTGRAALYLLAPHNAHGGGGSVGASASASAGAGAGAGDVEGDVCRGDSRTETGRAAELDDLERSLRPLYVALHVHLRLGQSQDARSMGTTRHTGAANTTETASSMHTAATAGNVAANSTGGHPGNPSEISEGAASNTLLAAFASEYRDSRTSQAASFASGKCATDAAGTASFWDPGGGYETTVHQVMGFFVTEAAVMGSTSGSLLPTSYRGQRGLRRWMSGLWTEATLQLTALFDRHVHELQDSVGSGSGSGSASEASSSGGAHGLLHFKAVTEQLVAAVAHPRLCGGVLDPSPLLSLMRRSLGLLETAAVQRARREISLLLGPGGDFNPDGSLQWQPMFVQTEKQWLEQVSGLGLSAVDDAGQAKSASDIAHSIGAGKSENSAEMPPSPEQNTPPTCPVLLPYSACVPRAAQVMREHLNAVCGFAAGVGSARGSGGPGARHGALDGGAAEAYADLDSEPRVHTAATAVIVDAVASTLGECLGSLLDGDHDKGDGCGDGGGTGTATLPIAQVCQLLVDASWHKRALAATEHHVAARWWRRGDGSTCENGGDGSATSTSATAGETTAPVALRGAHKALDAVMDRATGAVTELVCDKVHELVVAVFFVDYAPTEPRQQPHSFVDDLVSYLQVTSMSFTHLPRTTRESVYFISCKRIHDNMLAAIVATADELEVRTEMLRAALEGASGSNGASGGGAAAVQLQPVRKINVFGLHNLRLDLEAFRRFADECGVAQLGECFEPLAQLLKLLLSHDMEQFLEPAIRTTTYAQVSDEALLAVLDKYKELGDIMGTGKRRAAAAGLPVLKRKTVDAVARKLRQSQS